MLCGGTQCVRLFILPSAVDVMAETAGILLQPQTTTCWAACYRPDRVRLSVYSAATSNFCLCREKLNGLSCAHQFLLPAKNSLLRLHCLLFHGFRLYSAVALLPPWLCFFFPLLFYEPPCLFQSIYDVPSGLFSTERLKNKKKNFAVMSMSSGEE